MASPETHPVELPPAEHLNNGQGYPRITKSSPVRDLGPGALGCERCITQRAPHVLTAFFGLNQHTMKASFITDYNDTPDVCALPFAWMPFEVILDAYLQMIDEGKVEAVTDDTAYNLLDELDGEWLDRPWLIHQYTAADVARAVAAFKHLVIAIHARMPENDSKDNDSTDWMDLPWLDPATFTQQNVLPPSTFAHEFLTAIAHIKVRFRYVAPGLRFPTVSEFLDQPITDFKTPPRNDVGQFPGDYPLKIFQVVCDQPVPDPYIPRRTELVLPAGFYIYPVVQEPPLCYSNGCHLALPFVVGKKGYARKSNGEPFGRHNMDWEPKPRNEHAALYQPGLVDGFSERHDVQIDKVLRNWAERVERGGWDVDRDGVVGGIEKFREADTEEHWEK
ncbi:uncharacterized protein DSM5745_01998 [Aspergillus mulundensis]|uniref:Uncharacterized protein n=1 Tax=Aspergillus mulundensis TaxID=1810919 RepID=A0A3D8SV79_9EURO|nr:Uncharacterized protein DSM5745_01998 [Aspergillus mulundensis]RDW90223.1 Uncharacterized protein DSM5745_01998 [Aspergillus mulundensis]